MLACIEPSGDSLFSQLLNCTNRLLTFLALVVALPLFASLLPVHPSIACQTNVVAKAVFSLNDLFVSDAIAQEFSGRPISISAKALPLADFFRLITKISNLNVVVHPDIHGTITLELHNVAWDQVLSIVAKQQQLVTITEGNILFIVPADKVADFYR